MFTPARSVRAAAQSGVPFPELPALRQLFGYGFRPRSGQMLMIAGQSGCGKSRLALWLAAMLGVAGWDTLYISADSDPHTMLSRLAALSSGVPTDDVAENLGDYLEYVAGAPITFCFDSSPSIEDVRLELDGYVEVWDRFPRVIVVDNLMDLEVGDESHQGRVYAMQELHNLRTTGAAVIVLHHTLEGREVRDRPANRPQPLAEIENKLSKKPECVLTIADDPSAGAVWVSPVKNRNGPMDRTGRQCFPLSVEPSTGLFSTYVPRNLQFHGSH